MSTDASRALFHPFETGVLTPPDRRLPVLCIGATAEFHAPPMFGDLSIAQGFRPDFLALHRRGLAVSPVVQGSGYPLAMVLCGRSRGQNEVRIATALKSASDDATIIVAGRKDDGAASLARRVSELVPLAGRVSKFHSLVFWFQVGTDRGAVVDSLERPNHPALVEEEFDTAPGMFSHSEVDPGSRLLAEALPQLRGAVADFCAGWGFLAAEVLRRCREVTSLDVFEADYHALEAARRNLARQSSATATRFFWKDLLSETVADRYDGIVMNPPFHRGRRSEPELGQRLIEIASRTLKSRGSLFLVANRTLPYEKVLEGLFSTCRRVAGNDAFKVLAATSPKFTQAPRRSSSVRPRSA